MRERDLVDRAHAVGFVRPQVARQIEELVGGEIRRLECGAG